MPYRPASCKFGFLTDTHFSVMRTAFRTDDYFASVLSKFRECYRRFNDSGCEFVLHGGDMFDRFRSYSYQMILAVREVIVSSGIPTYFIWGQHDLMGYSRESSRGSNLNFLQQICDGRLIEIDRCVELKNLCLFASHVDQDCAETLRGISVPSPSRPVVAAAHALLYNAESSFGTINVSSIGRIRPVLVLSGDLHSGFPPTERDGTTYYNPGSLARTSRENRRPKAAVIELTPLLDGWNVSIEEFFPQCEEFPFPEQETEIAAPERQDSEEYIAAFEKFRAESSDIFERLEQVGRLHAVDPEVLEYIRTKGQRKG